MANPFVVDGAFKPAKLIESLLIVALAAAAGMLFTANAPAVYAGLRQPSFAPPAWLFSVVWPVLYLLIAVAAYRVGARADVLGPEAVRGAMADFYVQLLFNALWSALFFGFDLKVAALADLLITLVYAISATVKFFKIDKTAGWLMVPYVVWLAFAAVLNLFVVLMN